jgi:hypothetical protein
MALPSFATPIVTGISFLDMLKNYLILQLQQGMERNFIFQQDGAPLHFIHEVTSYLNHMMVAWIGWNDSLATTII